MPSAPGAGTPSVVRPAAPPCPATPAGAGARVRVDDAVAHATVPPMTRLLLVRHGQSEWNALGRWQGQADPPLTDLGRAQARHAAEHLEPFDLLASSTLVRAAVTADEIGRFHGVESIERDPDLVERDAGEFSGLTREEIDERFPGYLDTGRWPDGWEDDEPLIVRTRRAMERLRLRCPDGTIVAVTHGGVIYALEAALGAPFERIGNLGGRWFHLDGDDWSLGERVHLLDSYEETVPDQL